MTVNTVKPAQELAGGKQRHGLAIQVALIALLASTGNAIADPTEPQRPTVSRQHKTVSAPPPALHGIMGTTGDRIAYLSIGTAKVGQKLANYEVIAIDNASVTLKHNNKTTVLTLSGDTVRTIANRGTH